MAKFKPLPPFGEQHKALNNSITPPRELVEQWYHDIDDHSSAWEQVATQASRWGWEQRGAIVPQELQEARDDQLEECCAWLDAYEAYVNWRSSVQMREDLRPKPQSLAEEASKALTHILRHSSTELGSETICRALERLRELEEDNND